MRQFSLACLSAALLGLAGCATIDDSASAPSADSSAGLSATLAGKIAQPITPGSTKSQKVAALAAPDDLWQRIRQGFAMPDLRDEYVIDRESWYASRPDYIQRMTERSSKYLFHIVEELERRGMPTELALLPYVESAFNPQAVSSARAAGMWQFMPATGSDFDLKRNVFRDDRRDVLASTRAALDYLQKLYGMFGDWHLALAAYNWGEGSVGRAIAKNEKLGLPTGYGDLPMPNETRYYVPKLQAIKNIVANPASYSATLPFIGNHPYFQKVEIAHDIDVALAARLADVSLADFKALNPAAHKPVIFASGTPHILLPWDNATVFRRNLAAYNDGQYASWTAWTAPATLTAKAAAHMVGMNEADLRSINGIPPRMMVKAGSTLLVPRAATVKSEVPLDIADNGHVAFMPEPPVTRRISVRAGRHDSVASIAQRYRVSASAVATWNRTHAGARFARGQVVIVYVPVRTGGNARAESDSALLRQIGYSVARGRDGGAKPAAHALATPAAGKKRHGHR